MAPRHAARFSLWPLPACANAPASARSDCEDRARPFLAPTHFRCPQCRHVGVGLPITFAEFAALLITGFMFLQPAHAQSVPPGSYRASCTDIRVEDRTLTRLPYCRWTGTDDIPHRCQS